MSAGRWRVRLARPDEQVPYRFVVETPQHAVDAYGTTLHGSATFALARAAGINPMRAAAIAFVAEQKAATRRGAS